MKQPPEQDISGRSMDMVVAALLAQFKPGDFFLDVGAHVGVISVPVIQQAKPRKSLLIEPNPKLVELLKQNMQDVEGAWEVVEKAVWDKVEEKDFYLALAQGSLIDRGQKGEPLRLTTTTLDDEVDKHFPPDGDIVMKMDIELCEPFAFNGMKRNLHRVRYAVVEVMPHQMDAVYSHRQLLQELRNAGFRIYDLENGHEIGNSIGPTKVDIILKR